LPITWHSVFLPFFLVDRFQKIDMYREFKNLDLPALDKEILDFWHKENIFEMSVQQRSADDSFIFFEGPPSANGMPGIHHVMARTVKDLVCRFQSMRGKRVERKGGWDTHGLPIELNVEKELGITKDDIGQSITVEEFNQKCRETVMRFKDKWDEITQKMGYWVDLDDPYITFDNAYIESVWWLLRQLYDKNLLYKGYTIQPYSPAAGTGLSSHELNLPGCYREVTDTTVVAMFKVLKDAKSAFLFDTPGEDVRILAWTTTPWTLPSNTALTVGTNIRYVKVKTVNPYTQAHVSTVLAADLVGRWFGAKHQPEVHEKSEPFAGQRLEGIHFEQLMPFGNPIEPLDGGTKAFVVVLGDFVTTEDGTGVVHTAPSFGADDRRVAKANGIGTLTLVDKKGKFLDTVGEFSGRYVKNYKEDTYYESVDVDIVVSLKKENKALNVSKYNHNYPHCWRTDKPVLYYPLDSWFIRASACKDRMYELNQTINWKPASTGEGRFGKWLENLQDWNLSRSRFWGIPLPIWRTKDGESEKCIGSVQELATEVEQANQALNLQQSVPADLHRPYIDQVVLVSVHGEPMYRELDLIDVWFDSGSMPYAQWHYPFENHDKVGNGQNGRAFPADFIAEGVDQTRGWFYTLHAIATMVFDNVAFKNVVSNGLVLDVNGDKMSKSKGNVVDPFATIAANGADATRWYMISNADPWDNLKFDIQGVEEVKRKFFGTLFNTYNFFALYANIDGFNIDELNVIPIEDRPEIDRWIISKLQSLTKAVTQHMADYEPTKACREIETFVDDHLSNWYVRLSRRRFWKSEMSSDKRAAFETLYQCLMVTAQLMAPVAPFFADWLYKNLSDGIRQKAIKHRTPLRHNSIHLTDLTKVEENLLDLPLEERMDYAQRISSLVLSLRKKVAIRVRQPLSRVMLPVLDENFRNQVEAVKELIISEVNVKDIEYITDTAGLVKKRIKPNFKTLGKRLGKHMKEAADLIANLSQEQISDIERTGAFDLSLDGAVFPTTLDDFDITAEDIPGWQVASDGQLTVALDVTLNENLLAEGTARELVNRIQNLRKSNDFNVTDKIAVKIEAHEAIIGALASYRQYIQNETLAVALEVVETLPGAESVELLEDVCLKISVEVVS
jgi:isoleucyl-tRNA synthetase